MRLRYLILLMAGLAACSPAIEETVEPAQPQVRSTDFAILPCATEAGEAPCLEVRAGGKRLVFGAPSGTARSLSPETLAGMDALFLFSLNYGDVEGLDALRNRSWIAGRESPLRIAGPDGTDQLVAGLNNAFEVSDALAFVSEAPPGGFDAAVLAAVPGAGEARVRVFSTGDLEVTKLEDAGGLMAAYQIDYLGHVARIEPCGMRPVEPVPEGVGYYLSCSVENGDWPLSHTHFVYRE